MINPFILVPQNDRNIPNFQYLVQRAYKLLAEDRDAYVKDLSDFIDHIFEGE